MEFLNIQQFRDNSLVHGVYVNVTIFKHNVKDAIDQVYSNHCTGMSLETDDADVRARKLRYGINKAKWKN